MDKPLFCRIGNQTSWTIADPTVPFEFALRNGFTAFEWFPDRGARGREGWHEADLDARTRRTIRERARAADLALSVHAPLDYHPTLSASHDRLHQVVEFAQDIGAELLNLHFEAGEEMEAFVEALRSVLKLTAKVGLRLSLENTVQTSPEWCNRCFDLLMGRNQHSPPRAGMCFDLGHANLHPATRNDYLDFLDRLSPRVPIIHLHLHENHGDHDSHLTLFTGPAKDNVAGLQGLWRRLERRCFCGAAILEQWPQPRSLLIEARDRLVQMLNRDQDGRLRAYTVDQGEVLLGQGICDSPGLNRRG